MQLTKFHFLFVVEIAGGPQHEEERAVVSLDLGPLMRVDGVFDGQFVQIELTRERL